jgi:GH24 family phage-related lysozyme (muramidase)
MATALDILRHEEGFREKPYWDVTAYRVGYGSDTYTDASGRVHRVTPQTRVTREDAERDLARRTAEFQRGIENTIGADAWGRLAPGAQAALTSVAYNYGSIGKLKTLSSAARSGDNRAIANAIASLPANKDRRQREAALVLGQSVPYKAAGNFGAQQASSALPQSAYDPTPPVAMQVAAPKPIPFLGLEPVPDDPAFEFGSSQFTYKAPPIPTAPSLSQLGLNPFDGMQAKDFVPVPMIKGLLRG